MNLHLTTLNPNQRAAAEWSQGPLLVLAGPGSGKTRVLTMRIAKLLQDSPNKRFRVLGLTFTNKAAGEMRSRVEEMVPEARDRVLLTTFHSFCADILKQHGSHLGLSPDFVILNEEADREAILQDAIDYINAREGFDKISDQKLLPVIDRLLTENVSEEDIQACFRDQDFGQRVTLVHREYLNQLLSNNRLDFPALLMMTLRLFENYPIVTKQLRTVYPHICVDEFQDTNSTQYRILQCVAGDVAQNLFIVADDDQIIYQWNGASPERIKSLKEDYKLSTIQLPANYRCPSQVIALANKLIQHNLDRTADKEPLVAIKTSTDSNTVIVHKATSLDHELQWVANQIATRFATSPGECVILARTKKVLELAARYLTESGVQASFANRKSEFTSAPLRWLHALLRLANARTDRDQIRRLCKAFYELEGVDIKSQDVHDEAANSGGDLLRAWFVLAQLREGIDPITATMLSKGRKSIVDRLNFFDFIRVAFDWIGELESKLAGQNPEGFADYVDERSAWDELLRSILDKFGRDDLTLNTLLQEFDLSEKSPPIHPEAVRCLTIHTSKGMGFRHVFVVGLAEDQLPSFQSIKKGENSLEMQEERRNCFVAITRTLETLTLTYADTYFGWSKSPSRFLKEMQLI